MSHVRRPVGKRASDTAGGDGNAKAARIDSVGRSSGTQEDGGGGNGGNGGSLQLLRVAAAHSHRKGEREEMQDAHVIVAELWPHTADGADGTPPPTHIRRLSYYAVFDGHGGARAAQFAADNMHKRLAARILPGDDIDMFERTLRRTFVETYKSVDDEFLQVAAKGKPVWKDGATATTALLVNNTLFVANVGDSRAVLCRHKAAEQRDAALVLTKDHSPQLFDERMRIQKAGGIVRDGRILGVLEVSRSLGDGQYKNHGVSCTPDIKKCSLTENDRYAVIGCDGLWKSFSSAELVSFVGDVLLQLDAGNGNGSASASGDTATAAAGDAVDRLDKWHTVAAKLTSEAIVRGSGDNVTVVVIGLE